MTSKYTARSREPSAKELADSIKLDGNSTIVVLKPHVLQDGAKAEAVIAHIASICEDRGYSYSLVSIEISRGMAEMHFLGRGKEFIERAGRKVADALGSAGIDSGTVAQATPYELGRTVLEVHAREAEGKGALMFIIRGEGALGLFAQIKGSTDPSNAKPGTIRAMFRDEGENIARAIAEGRGIHNVVHMPDNIEELSHDVKTFFMEEAKIKAYKGLLRS